MADIEVPAAESSRTTILGYIKYSLTALTWIAGGLGVDVSSGGVPRLPDPGEKWYVYAVVIALGLARMGAGMLQSKAMADAKPKEAAKPTEPA